MKKKISLHMHFKGNSPRLDCWLNAGHLLALCQLTVRQSLSNRWLTGVGQQMAITLLTVGKMSVTCC